jgi:glycosyltransferase involved in cell wall biosynthesis
MSSAPTVSVVIPAYNAQDYIVETIDSVFAQTWPVLEVIVVNDGSTDATESILQSFGDRITLVTQDNGGVAKARNTGLQLAQGDYIAFLDSDDAWFPDKTAIQIEIMERNPDIAAMGSGCIEVNPAGEVIGEIIHQPYSEACWISREPPLLDMSDIGQNLMRNCLGSPSGLILRHSCLDEVGDFDEQLLNGSEDWDLFLRLALRYRTSVHASPLFRYRVSGEGLCAPRNADRLLKTDLMVLDKMFGQFNVQVPWWQRRQAYGTRYFKNAQAFVEIIQFSKARTTLFNAIRCWPPLLLRRSTVFMLIALLRGEDWFRSRQSLD